MNNPTQADATKATTIAMVAMIRILAEAQTKKPGPAPAVVAA